MQIDINEIKVIARRAGEEIMKYYKTDLGITYKKGDRKSPLTQADLVSNKIICEALKKYNFPILSEELADDKSRLNSECVWIVDPLDGTMDFIDRTGEFSVIIGLACNNEPVLGIVYEPVREVFYFAEKNNGSYTQNKRNTGKIYVSKKSNFQEMKSFISRNHPGRKENDFAKRVSIGEILAAGSAGIKICRVAEGLGDIYINSSDKTSEWDTCAGALILREAGGKITDMDGNDLIYNNENPRHLRGYVASNGTRHDDIIKALKTL